MTITHAPLTALSDAQLLAEVHRLVNAERHATAALIRSLMELDARQLYLAEGFSSLFAYCTQALRLSEHAAYGRIEAARAARRFPAILDVLESGSITLTTVTLLAKHLTPENHARVLAAARHKTKREVEHLVAELRPLPDVAAMVRRLPAPKVVTQAPAAHGPMASGSEPSAAPPDPRPTDTPCASEASPMASRRPAIAPLTPERYRVQLTVSRETHDKLRRAQDLLRHTIPSGDPAEIFDRALTVFVEQLEKAKCGAVTRPRSSKPSAEGSRHIPAAVRREVWKRDDGRCAFVGSRGRCSERAFLEFHHVVPYAAGGTADVSNIQLRCRRHNRFEADLFFGTDAVRERSPAWS
jgi:5-methylcytosine-specific restriction endonuclease McrA